MSVHRHFLKERQYFSMKPFNLLFKLSSNNVIVYMSKGTNALCTICKASGFVRSITVQPCSSIKSAIGLVLMTQFVY